MPNHSTNIDLAFSVPSVAAALRIAAESADLNIEAESVERTVLTKPSEFLWIEATLHNGGEITTLSLEGSIGGEGPAQEAALETKMSALVTATWEALGESHAPAPSPQPTPPTPKPTEGYR